MSWIATLGATDRDKLWNAIDLLTAEQPDADPDILGLQLSHTKQAAKCLANSFDVVEYPQLLVSIAGHVYTGPDSPPNSTQVTVWSPERPTSGQADEIAPGATEATEPAGETKA